MEKRKKLLAATVAILVCSFFQISSAASVENTGQKSSPAELIEQAGEYFSGELASQVQEQISRDMQESLRVGNSESRSESIATLFLADRFYRALSMGQFNGLPTVTWNGFDVTTKNPIFVYRETNFSYTSSSSRQIVPKTMYTDGGSIPKLLHSVGKFTPWGYGPAYIIHDWLFVAHKCDVVPDNDIDFETSAVLLAESIKTLMENGIVNVDGQVQKFPKKEDTLYLIYQAVSSQYARRLWNDTDGMDCS